MPTPLLTIGIPCRNGEKTLPLTLQSIFAQTFQDWELIIVNDGSTDGTAAILDSLDDPRVRVVHHVASEGMARSLNEITAIARGTYIARMDADDIMFPDRLERQLAMIKSTPEFDLVGGATVIIDEGEEIRGLRIPPHETKDPERIFRGGVLYHPTALGRTEWFTQNPYDPTFGMSADYALWVRSCPNLKVVNLQDPVLFYRETTDVLTNKYWTYTRLNRKAVRSFGPSRIGHLQTQLLVMRRFAKDMVYWVLTKLNLRQTALGLRNKKLSDEETARYADILDQIRAVKLPVKSGHVADL